MASSPQTQPAPKPATAKRGAKQQPEPETPKLSIAKTTRESLQEDLEEHLKPFLKRAWFEEKHFLNAVLQDWADNMRYGGDPKPRGEREIPLFSAIETNLSGYNCIPCPDYLIEEVTKFIDENDTGRPDYRAHPRQLTAVELSQIQRRRRDELRLEFEDFLDRAGDDDVYTLLEILTLHHNISEFNDNCRPDDIMRSAATQMLDRNNWLIKAPSEYLQTAQHLVALLGTEKWVSYLLGWIAKTNEENPEALTPCAVAAEAQKRQKQFDADVKKALELKKDFPKLVA